MPTGDASRRAGVPALGSQHLARQEAPPCPPVEDELPVLAHCSGLCSARHLGVQAWSWSWAPEASGGQL